MGWKHTPSETHLFTLSATHYIREKKKCTPTNSFPHLCFASSLLIDSVYFSGTRFHHRVTIMSLLHWMQHPFVLSKECFPLSRWANWNGNILILSATKWQYACISDALSFLLALKVVQLCSWLWHNSIQLSKVIWLAYHKHFFKQTAWNVTSAHI